MHVANVLRIKVSYNMIEDMMLKYTWSALGYLYASLPVFLPNWSGASSLIETRTTATDNKESSSPSIAMARREFGSGIEYGRTSLQINDSCYHWQMQEGE